MKTKRLFSTLIVALAAPALFAAEFHVAPSGNNANDGSSATPLGTIQAAADRAQPGDVITVHEGVYRERVNPPRGGTSDEQRIIYRAAPGEQVIIKGSEVVTGWKKAGNDTWTLELENSFFDGFNPFSDLLGSPCNHWFYPHGEPATRIPEGTPEPKHHTGAVYLNGEWLDEAQSMEAVLEPVDTKPLWFAKVTDTQTILWAQFPKVDPNKELTEVNARAAVFFPEEPGLNYITVRGFILRHAASPWAPPTARGQRGLIGPHWSKGWIIEDNVISHAATVGVQLGNKDLGEFDGNVHGMNAIYAEGVRSGEWTKEKVGGHIIRRNQIHDCGAAGINGNMGCAFSVIENNIIHDIHVERNWSGLEQGGIKLHGAIDVVIRNNVIYRSGTRRARALWLDWLGQGAVIEGNICFDNNSVDFFNEVSHGPTLVANNVFLSRNSVVSTARGAAYVNNYISGTVEICQTTRKTPYAEPHSTKLIEQVINTPLDDRFINNIFAGEESVISVGFGGVTEESLAALPFDVTGNLYLAGAKPSSHEQSPVVLKGVDEPFVLKQNGDEFVLEWNLDPAWLTGATRPVVTAERLGLSHVGNHPFEYPDGTPVVVNRDLLGRLRDSANSMPGPVDRAGKGSKVLND